ncbi:MAG: hypothetical protein JOZ80_02850 [Acidobacteriaceae bacterium]|nr:hypothetical protein [Acidobacteriaceae bacterium]
MDNARSISRVASDASPTLRDIAAVLFRQKRVLLITFVTTFLMVFLYGVFWPPYQTRMKILLRHSRLDPEIAAVPSQPEFVRQAVTEEEVNSETELLQNDDLLHDVIERTGLVTEGRSWVWQLLGDNREQQLERATRRVRKRLSIDPAHKAAVISVSYASSDRQQGAKVLSALANAYLERHHEVHRPSGALDFFEQQVDQSRRTLEAAELQLIDFNRNENVVAAVQQRDFELRKVSEIDADLGQTDVAMAQISQRSQSLQSKLNSIPERALTQVRNWDNPELLEKLKSRLLELELKRTELLTQYEPSYRLVQQVEAEIDETKQTIATEAQIPLRDQTSDLEPNHQWARSELIKAEIEASALDARRTAENALLASCLARARRFGNRAIEQDRLLNSLKAAEEQYLLYVNKREEARIGDALDRGGILNATVAEKPTIPALPNVSPMSFGLLGLIMAAVCGVGTAVGTDYFSPAFRTPQEIKLCLQAPVIAWLPPSAVMHDKDLLRGRRR